ncbi:MAG: copper-binding protein [Planctomycetota bacterium]
MPTVPTKTLSQKLFNALLTLALAGPVFLAGCSENAQDQAESEAARDILVNTYEVRGRVTALPKPDDAASALMIHHERIPDFVNNKGEIDPMREMIMSFPVDEGVDLSGVAVGDSVAFDFVVTWGGLESGWVLTEIEKLPAETPLDLGAPNAHDHDAHGHGHGDHAGHNH